MASYSVAKSKHATLVASTADTVAFTTDWPAVEVVNKDASAAIYFTVSGVAPTVAGDDTLYVGPGQSVIERSNVLTDPVKLISSGTPAYAVTGVS